jgi:uncharacterized protein (DUF1330 family)
VNPFTSNADISIYDEYKEVIARFAECFGQKAMADLNEAQSLADKEVCDLLHYIEFKDLSAVQGFKIYKRLQDVLKKRRVVKNKLAFVRALSESKAETILSGKIESRHIRETVAYTPRILTDLFD